jgi:uncharacterized small protein (DUF1192 family)
MKVRPLVGFHRNDIERIEAEFPPHEIPIRSVDGINPVTSAEDMVTAMSALVRAYAGALGMPLDKIAIWAAQIMTTLANDAGAWYDDMRERDARLRAEVERLKRERPGLSIMAYRSLAAERLGAAVIPAKEGQCE